MQHYNRIRDLREDKDLTQEQLIKLLGMHKTTYTNYEQGKHSVLLDFAVELAQFYKVSLDYIAGLTNEKDGLTKSSLDSTETEVVYKLRKLNDIDKGRILGMMDALIEKGK